MTAKHRHLTEGRKRTRPWKRWGPYLSGRQWGTLRGDYSAEVRTRSLIGLLPLIAVEVLEGEKVLKLKGFTKRVKWFINHRADPAHHFSVWEVFPSGKQRIPAIPSRPRLERLLKRLLDGSECLSPHGIRSLSRVHLEQPSVFRQGEAEHRVDHVPGESNTYLFGGNSNWRGPVWFPINYLIIEALERCAHFYGHGGAPAYANDPHWNQLLLFHEYFLGETGRGCGASQQTGWTALAVRCLAAVPPLPNS